MCANFKYVFDAPESAFIMSTLLEVISLDNKSFSKYFPRHILSFICLIHPLIKTQTVCSTTFHGNFKHGLRFIPLLFVRTIYPQCEQHMHDQYYCFDDCLAVGLMFSEGAKFSLFVFSVLFPLFLDKVPKYACITLICFINFPRIIS